MTKYRFEEILLTGGWQTDQVVSLGEDGRITGIEAAAPDSTLPVVRGIAVPGLPNLHSHAFQRAMAGLAERAGPGADSFWTWRQVMYGFLETLGPDDVERIATGLYGEMLKAGYTSVAEFHYLHHAPDGSRYANIAEMSERIAAAASATGIGLTLCPVLYAHGGFGGTAPNEGQRRFINDADSYLDLLEGASRAIAERDGCRLGIAPHSLRAVTGELLDRVLADSQGITESGPVHIHISEQEKEVEDCLAWSGARPVEWLHDHADVDERWCLVHATHVTESERRKIAASGAVAGLCPTTEANLGDGLFPIVDYHAEGGAWGIGSDSHISVSPVEELRWLEYGQRLVRRGRNLVSAGPGSSTGRTLYDAALAGGARALGQNVGRLATGCRADIVVIDRDAPTIAGRSGDAAIDSWLFAGNQNPVRDVMAGGRWVVRDGELA
ncbi:MAG: formimidoylglutamate deiminase [Rhodospirillales bacterium]